MRCSRLRYDIERRDYCNLDGHQTKPYHAACDNYNPICGRFGGWTKNV